MESPKTPQEQHAYDVDTLELALGCSYVLNEIKPFADGPGIVERIRELAVRHEQNPPKEKWVVLCLSHDESIGGLGYYKSWQFHDTEEQALEAVDLFIKISGGFTTRKELLVCRCSEIRNITPQ